jgi:phytoene desaturase
MSRIAIIGGGIGGLALAPLLAKQGHEVHLYEKNSWLGGRAGVLRKQGFTFDTGPSWLMMPEVFEEWFESLGYQWKDFLTIIKLDPSYKIFWSDGSLAIPRDYNALRNLFESIEVGSAEKLDQYYQYTQKVFELSNKVVLNRSFKSFFDYMKPEFWQPFTHEKIKFVGNLQDEIHTRFHHPRLRQTLLYQLAFLGTPPAKTSRVYATLNYIDMRWGVLYPLGGISSLIRAMIQVGQKKGVTYHKNSPVQKILHKKNKANGVLVGGKIEEFDIVVSNAHREFTHKQLLGRKLSKKYPSAPSAVLIFAGIKGRLEGVAHHNLFFADDYNQYYKDVYTTNTIPEDPNFYMAAASVTDSSVAPKGCENLSWVIPVSSMRRMDTQELSEFVYKVIATTEQKLGQHIKANLMFLEYRAHEYFAESFNAPHGTAIGIPNLATLTGPLRPKFFDSKLKNLYYVGADTHPGIGMPMCILSAQNLAKELSKQATTN